MQQKKQEVQIQYIVCSISILLFFLLILIFHHAQYRLIQGHWRCSKKTRSTNTTYSLQ